MKQVEVDKGFLWFSSDEPTAKRMGATYLKSKFMWRLPDTLGALRELYKAGYDVEAYGKAKTVRKLELMELKNDINAPVVDERLRPYQNADIRFLQRIPHAGVFNQQRTGEQNG